MSTVGAGDAFCAGLLTIALCTNTPQTEALRIANAVGAAVVADPRSQPFLTSISEYY